MLSALVTKVDLCVHRQVQIYRIIELTILLTPSRLQVSTSLEPLFVKGVSKSNKTYILLLTCASSCAVHLELVPNMSVDGFLRGFKRFMARRGIGTIISDNFKTFKSAEVKKFMMLQGVTQKFILPASPWWDGFYERLVRSVKTCFKEKPR